MADPLYDRLIKNTVIPKIKKYGKKAAIVRNESSGPPYAPVIIPVPYDCILLETSYSLTNRDATLIQSGDKVGIISTELEIDPELSDKIQIDGVTYSFVDLQPLNPGGLVMLYEFQARK